MHGNKPWERPGRRGIQGFIGMHGFLLGGPVSFLPMLSIRALSLLSWRVSIAAFKGKVTALLGLGGRSSGARRAAPKCGIRTHAPFTLGILLLS
jgi:hypothetical protein